MGFPLGGFASSVIIGAADGAAASADSNAGRAWDTPGATLGATPVIAWGWAPGVQMGSIGIGAALLASGARRGVEVGESLLTSGVALVARALAFKAAQHGQATPVATQGFISAQVLPGDWSHQHDFQPYVDEEPGSLAWSVDQKTGSLA